MSKILVADISPMLQKQHLVELFECCGSIIEATLTDNPQDESRMCVIEFSDPNHAKAAAFLSGTPLGDRNIKVEILPEGTSTESALGPGGSGGGGVSHNPFSGSSNPLLQQVGLPMVGGGGAGGPATSWNANSASGPPAKKPEEYSRTIYCGNLNPMCNDMTLKQFFAQSGDVLAVKMAGDQHSNARFAFVEFRLQEQADKALTQTGSTIGDRVIRVGRANNPILPVKVEEPVEARVDEAMKKVREAMEKISKKVEKKARSESSSRSRSRSRGRRSSRSSRKHRSRSRSSRSSRSDRSDSREKRREREEKRREEQEKKRKEKEQKKKAMEGLFWDGFQWVPKTNFTPQ